MINSKTISVMALCAVGGLADADGSYYVGRYCEIDGAETDDGRQVTGECYMYSDRYGELGGAQTEDGESVTGECFRYSNTYAELDGAETSGGISVSGECFFYGLSSRRLRRER